MRRGPVLLAFLTLSLTTSRALAAAGAPPDPAAAEADRIWETRAEGSSGGLARTGPVDALIAVCQKGLTERPGSIELRWRLMRALYFKGEYVVPDTAGKRGVFDEGKRVGEEALTLVRREATERERVPLDRATPVELVPHVKARPEVLAAFYWASVDWGKWALVFGKTAAVRKGAAAKIRDYSTAVIALDPLYEDGGGYRVLGRLHHQTPYVPLLTGWASREEALKNLRLSVRVAPENFINRFYLAEAVHDYESSKRGEARKALESLVAATPSPSFVVEDRKTQDEARADLAAWGRD